MVKMTQNIELCNTPCIFAAKADSLPRLDFGNQLVFRLIRKTYGDQQAKLQTGKFWTMYPPPPQKKKLRVGFQVRVTLADVSPRQIATDTLIAINEAQRQIFS